jgi:hypothetical protein
MAEREGAAGPQPHRHAACRWRRRLAPAAASGGKGREEEEVVVEEEAEEEEGGCGAAVPAGAGVVAPVGIERTRERARGRSGFFWTDGSGGAEKRLDFGSEGKLSIYSFVRILTRSQRKAILAEGSRQKLRSKIRS